MKRILVTGGAGFMGSNVVRHFLTSYPEYHVVNFDKLTYAANSENLADVAGDTRYTFVQGDICDADALARVIEEQKIDIIVNYAAETHVDRSIADPDAFLKTDIFGTKQLLEATKKFGIEKMVHISTDEVFGSTETGSFTEESPFRPNSPYSASKAGGDLLCRAYYETYRTPVVVTHSCNVYGPYQYPEKFIPLFITNLLESKKVPVYGDGKNIREWIYVLDHCRAIDVILHKAQPGSVYNIGTGDEIMNIDLTKRILQELDLDETYIEYVKDRPGHDRRYRVDSSKLRRELEWLPQMSFDAGLHETVAWYKDHGDWWKKIKSGEFKTFYQKQYGAL